MSIIQIPNVEEIKKKPNIEITDKSYETPVADSRVDDFNVLSTYAEGYKWSCDLYIQLVSNDINSVGFDTKLLDVNYQLKKIKGFELVVDTPLSMQQETDNVRSFEVTGTSKVYSVLSLNEGDFFIADIGDGRNGVFTITSVGRSTYYRESFTIVEYRQIAILDKDLYSKIEKKVVEELFFDRELMRSGTNPIITTKEVDTNRKLLKLYSRLSNLYLHEFFNTSVKSIVLPKQAVRTYDPYMVRFVLRTFDRSICKRLGDVIDLDQYPSSASRTLSVLDAIERLDEDLLWSTSNKVVTSAITGYNSNPFLNSFTYSGVKSLVTLTDRPYTSDTENLSVTKLSIPKSAGSKRPLDHLVSPELFGSNLKQKSTNDKYIKRVSIDDYYIFSESFYKDSEDMSVLEKMVRDKLSGKVIDLDLLSEVADSSEMFDNLERFYYVPIILALIKMTRGVF